MRIYFILHEFIRLYFNFVEFTQIYRDLSELFRIYFLYWTLFVNNLLSVEMLKVLKITQPHPFFIATEKSERVHTVIFQCSYGNNPGY